MPDLATVVWGCCWGFYAGIVLWILLSMLEGERGLYSGQYDAKCEADAFIAKVCAEHKEDPDVRKSWAEVRQSEF